MYVITYQLERVLLVIDGHLIDAGMEAVAEQTANENVSLCIISELERMKFRSLVTRQRPLGHGSAYGASECEKLVQGCVGRD